MCEFGDAMMEGTGLEGSATVYSSLRTLTFVVDRMFRWEGGR